MVDFNRNIHCLMGLPIDAVSLHEAAHRLDEARTNGTRCFFSTPNLNFVIASQKSREFRRSVCMSDLSLADGMPLVWVAKLLGIPIRERVSGSSLFEFLRSHSPSAWNVFFFGGQKGVGQDACLAIGDKEKGMRPTGYIYPGFVGIDKMSDAELIDCINTTHSDMLVVSLGAAKGQAWICNNLGQLNTPVVAHLGAVINFVAGTVARAPQWMQSSGLEWLWRIHEESSLLRRYWSDGLAFMRLLTTRVVPLAIWQFLVAPHQREYLRASLSITPQSDNATVCLHGAWRAANAQPLRAEFARLVARGGPVTLDMSDVTGIDSAVIGLLMLLQSALESEGRQLRVVRLPAAIRSQLKLAGAADVVAQ